MLRDHRIVFTWDSHAWEGGVAHVLPERGRDTWGVLWELTEDHLRALDRYERVEDGIYARTTTHVLHDGRAVEALIYLANDSEPKAPSKRYLRALVRGARAHGLPAEYVAALEALVRARPTRARAAR